MKYNYQKLNLKYIIFYTNRSNIPKKYLLKKGKEKASSSSKYYLTKNSYHNNWLPLFTKGTDIKIASSWSAISL